MAVDNNKTRRKLASSVKVSKDLHRLIYFAMLDTFKFDDYTKQKIKEKLFDTGKFKYLNLIKRYPDFLTPLRLMIIVDRVDILKAFKYFLNEHTSENYDKNISKDYNLISGLHSAELKLIMLEYLYEVFKNECDISVIFHQPEEKIDALVEVCAPVSVNLNDSEGYMYVNTLNCGKYAFESRCCSSITDVSYILNNEKRTGYLKKFDKYFFFVPKDSIVDDNVLRELEHNNIKIVFSDYSTIDIVNDVAYMEGIVNRK